MTTAQEPTQPSGETIHQITVLYRAFEDTPVPVTFPYSANGDIDYPALCEQLFEQTNTYQGPLFALMQPDLESTRNAGRHHTALSVGDHIATDGQTWECAPLGWTTVPQAWERVSPRNPTHTPHPPDAPAPAPSIHP